MAEGTPVRNVLVEDDLFEFIMSLSRHGEGFDAIVRREIGFPGASGDLVGSVAATSSRELPSGRDAGGNLAFGDTLSSPAFLSLRDTTRRYLFILGEAYRRDPSGFSRVLDLGGRKRRYFAKSSQEIEVSGTSTHPQQIPGSDCWAMTNADTKVKQGMLRQALSMLGYDRASIEQATAAIAAEQGSYAG
jgi:negative regulator of replication initiation